MPAETYIHVMLSPQEAVALLSLEPMLGWVPDKQEPLVRSSLAKVKEARDSFNAGRTGEHDDPLVSALREAREAYEEAYLGTIPRRGE